MKRITAILLFATLLFPLVGTYMILQYQQDAVRSEVKWKIASGLDKEDLTFFSFHKNEVDSLVDWKHSKEFEYKGQMYDIVERTLKNDSLHFWCWWDYEETQLNKMLDELVASAMQTDSKTDQKSKKVLQFLKSFYFGNSTLYSTENLCTSMKWGAVGNSFISISPAPPVPPPRNNPHFCNH